MLLKKAVYAKQGGTAKQVSSPQPFTRLRGFFLVYDYGKNVRSHNDIKTTPVVTTGAGQGPAYSVELP